MSFSCLLPISCLHCTLNNEFDRRIGPRFSRNYLSLPFQSRCLHGPPRISSKKASAAPTASAVTVVSAEEVLPPVLDASSDPPSLFDGTTRLYTSYICPYAQRVWIARNYKGLQEKIKLVPIDLENRPDWYKEKVYSPNKKTCSSPFH